MAVQNSGPSFVAASAAFGSQFFFSGQPYLFSANGALYLVQQTFGSGGANINGTAVFKSTNNGTSWTELDAAHAPTAALGAAFFDQANNQIIFGLVTDTFPQSAQATFLQNFSLATETWGSAYATDGPNAVTVVQFCFKRPDSSIFIVYDFGSSNPGGTTRLRGAYWNGSAWSASIDLGANTIGLLASGAISVSETAAAMDSTGNIHLFFTSTNRTTFQYYQQINTSNALVSGVNLTGSFSPATNHNVFGTTIVCGSNIVVSTVTGSQLDNTVLVGTPLSAPAFSVISPASLVAANRVRLPGPIGADASGNLYWMCDFLDSTLTYDFYQIAKSTDCGNTWAILSDNLTAPYFYDFAPGQSPLAPNADPTFAVTIPYLGFANSTLYGFADVHNDAAGTGWGYFMNSEVLAGAGPSKFEISLFGVKRWIKPEEPACVEHQEPAKIKRVM